jgi:hypothetical protein
MANPMTEVIIKDTEDTVHGPYYVEEADFEAAVQWCLDNEPDLSGKTMQEGWVGSVVGNRSRYFLGPPA